MKKIKYLSMTLAIIFMVSMQFQTVFASSFQVNAKNNGNGTLTVTVSGQVVGAFKVEAGNKSTQLAIRNLGGSDSTTLNTGAGTYNVQVTAISISDAQYNVIEGEKVTKSVTVTTKNNEKPSVETPSGKPSNNSKPTNSKKKEKLPSENLLESLSVSTGTLSPEFSPKETSYKVEVTSEVTTMKINAKTKDSKAKVSGIGDKDLKIGENNFMISVIAENGNKKTYTISVYVTEKPSQFIEFNKKDYGILTNFSKADLPKGYTPTTIKIEGKEINALKNETTGLTLLYLQDSEGKTSFYIYENNTVVGLFQTVTINQKIYVVLDNKVAAKDLNGIKEATIKIGDLKVQGWTFEDKNKANYSLVYLINDSGEKGFYLYENTEKTFQKYVPDSSSSNNTLAYVFIGTTVILGITNVVSIIMYFNFKNKSIKTIKDYYVNK